MPNVVFLGYREHIAGELCEQSSRYKICIPSIIFISQFREKMKNEQDFQFIRGGRGGGG